MFFVLAIDASSAGQKAVPPLTLGQLKNTTYVVADYKDTVSVKLVEGKFVAKKWPPESREFLLWMDLTKWVKFGDLNGDGIEDAAVIYVWNGGGTGWFYHLGVVLNENGKPKHVASAYLGDRIKINSLEVESGTILLDMVTGGRHDPACCPNLNVRVKYKYLNGNLSEQTDWFGVYEGTHTETNGIIIQMKLAIKEDMTSEITTMYSDGRPPTNKKGKWRIVGDGSIYVDFRGGNSSSNDNFFFRMLDGKLTSISDPWLTPANKGISLLKVSR